MPEKRPCVSRGAARGAPRLAAPRRWLAVVEDCHDAASHRQTSHEDTRLGAEARDPTESRDLAEEEADQEEEADLPSEA